MAVPFTRDFDSIRSKLLVLEEGDKTCIDAALLGVNQLVLNEWGCQTPVQIILVLINFNYNEISTLKLINFTIHYLFI